jgi:class 3 adenylate cyclase/YHS domain-containing protein
MNSYNSESLTVLFADLSGFTALTETHGDQDASDIAERFYALAQESLTGDARLVKTIGDAVMIVATNPATAIGTALKLVASVEAEPGFPAVRVGLHVGPCIERRGDYFGATVNIAARVTAFARSGQVLCTEPVAEAIRNLNIAALQPAGAERFRNVSQLMTLFELHDPHRPLVSGDFDPVCRMRLDPERAPARLPYGDRVYYFCSFNCAQKFARTPEVYALT